MQNPLQVQCFKAAAAGGRAKKEEIIEAPQNPELVSFALRLMRLSRQMSYLCSVFVLAFAMVTQKSPTKTRGLLQDAEYFAKKKYSNHKDLLSRLQDLFHAFRDLEQPAEGEAMPFSGNLATSLVGEHYLSHPNTDIQLLVSCIVSDVFRVNAPEHPFSPEQLKNIFDAWLRQFELFTKQKEKDKSQVCSVSCRSPFSALRSILCCMLPPSCSPSSSPTPPKGALPSAGLPTTPQASVTLLLNPQGPYVCVYVCAKCHHHSGNDFPDREVLERMMGKGLCKA